MDFKTIVSSRYATKKFDGKLIDQKKIDELCELIRMAPSSFNIQPWKIKIVSDKKLKEQLFPLSYNQEQVTSCSHLFVFCANTDVFGNIDKLEAQLRLSGMSEDSLKSYVKMMRGAFTDSSEDFRLSWAQRQLYLALENALLGAKWLGFDSCPMEGFDPAGYAKVLNLPKNLVPTALCALGFAVDKSKLKVRFAKGDVFF